ncbi:MAG: GNAT family N-acetyltransferase [bacterium]|nr:GNAT family N-acetyltransferase [bacterium]
MTDQPVPETKDRDAQSAPEDAAVRIETLTSAHVGEAVELHMHAFPDFFLTFLGRSFLRQMYLAYADDPGTIALVANAGAGDQVIGAVVGPLEPASFFRRTLLRRWWRFGLAAVGAVVRHPGIVPRMLRAVRYRGDAPEDGAQRALLASIAVGPASQGLGVGKHLTQAFLEQARSAGAPGVYLTTDADDNDAVNTFYRRRGWVLEGSFATPENRRMHRYTWDFSTATD